MAEGVQLGRAVSRADVDAVGVVISMGEVRVALTSPAPAGFAQLDIEPMRRRR